MRIVPDVIPRQDLLTVTETEVARDAARRMVARRISSILVIDEAGRLAGIVTERDFTRCFADAGRDPDTVTVGDIMTRTPDTLEPDDLPRSALELMELRGYRHLPVVDRENRPIGIVSIRDLYAIIMRLNEDILAKTQTYVFGDRYNLED